VARTSEIRTLTSSQLFGLTAEFEHVIHAPSRAGGPMTSDLSCSKEIIPDQTPRHGEHTPRRPRGPM